MLSTLIGPHKSMCNICNFASELGTVLGLYDALLLLPCSYDGHKWSFVYLNLRSPLTMLSLANLLMVSKLRWDNLQCHNQDFVSYALVIRQIGDEEAIWLMSIAYKLVPRFPVKRSAPSKFRMKHVILLNATSKSASQNCPTKNRLCPNPLT